MKLRGVSNGKGLAASYNAQVQPEKVPSHNDFGDEWTPEKPKESREVELGERALRIPSLSPSPGKEAEVQAKQDGRPWKLYRPFRAGKLNYASYMDDFGSAAERVLINDTQAMFEGIISSPREDLSAPGKSVEGMGQTLYGLGIPRKQYSAHSVILLVPDLFPKYDLRALTQLLLVDMGFSQIIVQQESTAATYGAGMSSACVIHAGGERISISCVDEGLLLQETRMHLDYGGEDVTQFLHQLLVRANFGYKDCSPALRVADTLVLEDLKKQMITLDASQIGLFIFNFYLRLPSVATKKWEVRVYDEAILAPMALFGLGVRVIDFAKKDEERKAEAEWGQKDDEDLDDGSERRYAITLAMNSSVRHLIPQAAPTPAPAAPAPTNGGEEAADSATPSRDTNGASTPGPVAGSSSNMTLSASNDGQQKAPTPARSTPAPPPLAFFDVRKASSQLPLDVALYHSLLASTTAGGTLATGEERMKKLASNILVVGGSARIPGLDGVIEAR
jgi:actin-related protein 8